MIVFRSIVVSPGFKRPSLYMKSSIERVSLIEVPSTSDLGSRPASSSPSRTADCQSSRTGRKTLAPLSSGAYAGTIIKEEEYNHYALTSTSILEDTVSTKAGAWDFMNK